MPSEQQFLFQSTESGHDEQSSESNSAARQHVAQVVFNRPLDTAYSYFIPQAIEALIGPGQRVRAPFGRGNRLETGFCVGIGPPPADTSKLKSIESLIDREPLVSPKMLTLTEWIAQRYLCGWGQVLESVIPAGVKKQAGTRIVTSFQIAEGQSNEGDDVKLPVKQRAIMALLRETSEPLTATEITDAIGCGTSPLNSLRKKGLIVAGRERTESFMADVGAVTRVEDLTLNHDQQRALDLIHETLHAGRYATILLHGVTGSGKTEVYIQAIREVISFGRQAIVLVPEISLTPQTIRRFRSRFDSVAVLHSHLSDAERHWHWQQIARGAVQVVVGARSAVFAPTPNLGLIVIDEEHETTFKQETAPRYHAREVARRRAELHEIPLVLGSATPTLESWMRAQLGVDQIATLPTRVEARPLPPVVLVDIRNDPECGRGRAIGRALETATRAAIKDGGQVIYLLNLRGFTPVLWCSNCGQSIRCVNCDLTLTWHRDRNKALCHGCELEVDPPQSCPHCNHRNIRHLGIGTQRLEHEVRARFPGVACIRMDSDSMRKPGSHDIALEAFRKQEYQILLGTQMIAKGLDFPNVTLVGVISADTLLNQPDIRAAERTFQLISQVAGRTGRSDRGGRVLVQTASPSEPAIRAAAEHDFELFARREMRHREEMSAPPYWSLVRIIFRGPLEGDVRDFAKQVVDILRKQADASDVSIRILGPAPAPITRIRKFFRYHVQLSCRQLEPMQILWQNTVPNLPKPGKVELVVDVDPINMR